MGVGVGVGVDVGVSAAAGVGVSEYIYLYIYMCQNTDMCMYTYACMYTCVIRDSNTLQIVGLECGRARQEYSAGAAAAVWRRL